MLNFENILYLAGLAVLVPVLLLFWRTQRWRKKVKQSMGESHLVNKIMPGIIPGSRLRKTALFMCALALLVLALANLQKPGQQSGPGLNGLDVIIALDVSNSLLANDLQPNRLENARLFAARLIDTLQGNQVGLIAFAGAAYLQLPLTTDISAARLYLQSINTGLAPQQGTNIHAALMLANQSMDPTQQKFKAVILLTDGEEWDEKALDAAKTLRESGLVVFPVGVGTPGGATVPDPSGAPKQDEKGQTVISRLNEGMLQELAKEGNGRYFSLQKTGIEKLVTEMLAELKNLDKKHVVQTTLVNYKSYAHWFIGFAIILLMVECFLPEKKNRKPGSLVKNAPAGKATAMLLLFTLISLFSVAQNAKAQLRKANDAYLKNDFETAEKLYQEVLKTEPANNIARFNLGNIAYRKKQFEEAAAKFDETSPQLNKAPDKAGASNNKGLSMAAQKNWPEAINAFKDAIRQQPFDEEVRRNLEKAIKEQKKEEEQKKKPEEKPDPKKDPKKQPPPKMKQKEAEEKLQALRQEEKKIRDKQNKKEPVARSSEKDW